MERTERQRAEHGDDHEVQHRLPVGPVGELDERREHKPPPVPAPRAAHPGVVERPVVEGRDPAPLEGRDTPESERETGEEEDADAEHKEESDAEAEQAEEE